MHGNVWEWTNTLYKPYPYKAEDGRESPSDTAWYRVLRGGSFFYSLLATVCRAANRNNSRPTECSDLYGFRLCVSGEAPR